MVFDLQLSPADNSLVAFTHGNGTYKADLSSLPVGTHSTTDAVSDFTLISNPVRSLLSCRINSNRSFNADFVIHTIDGKRVNFSLSKSVSSGRTIIDIPVSELANGIYFITMNTGEKKYTRKFLKVNE
ncbi:MAG TPA: T9SS type A sorting domain-containing protein [Bacteroidia bacterium]|nr:T9SS type A sorting domain-containing protein [Bacteroidia bacterium]